MTSAAPAFLTFGRETSAAYKFAQAGYDGKIFENLDGHVIFKNSSEFNRSQLN